MRLLLLPLLLPLLLTAAVASEEAPPPRTVSPGDQAGGKGVAETLFSKSVEELTVQPEHAYLCPVCGQPMWKHVDGFECVPPGMKPLKSKQVDACCPVCGLRFKAPLPGGRTDLKDVDSDFCWHPIGADSFASTAWLCPRCGFAARHNLFNKPLSPDLKRFVRDKLTARTEQDIRRVLHLSSKLVKDLSFLEQPYIPEMITYRNAVAIAEQTPGASALERAQLYLEAVHAARRTVAARIKSAFLSAGLQAIEELFKSELPGRPLPVPQKIQRLEDALASGRIAGRPVGHLTEFCMNVELAALYDRKGDREQAAACLNAARAVMSSIPRLTNRNAAVLGSDLALRQGALRSEAAFAASAVESITLAVENGEITDHGAFLAHSYLLADLNRRLARYRQARSWYETLSPLAKKLDPSLASWTEQALAEPAMQVPPDPKETEKAQASYAKVGADKLAALGPRQPAEAAPRPAPTAPSPSDDPWHGAPADCADLMQRFYRSVQAFREKHAAWPKTVKELAAKGFIPGSLADDLVCPDTGIKLFYKAPSGRGGRADFILFHKNPTKCKCRNILYSDGSVGKVPGQ